MSIENSRRENPAFGKPLAGSPQACGLRMNQFISVSIIVRPRKTVKTGGGSRPLTTLNMGMKSTPSVSHPVPRSHTGYRVGSRVRIPNPPGTPPPRTRQKITPCSLRSRPTHSSSSSCFFPFFRSLALVPPTISYSEESLPKSPFTTERDRTI